MKHSAKKSLLNQSLQILYIKTGTKYINMTGGSDWCFYSQGIRDIMSNLLADLDSTLYIKHYK